MNMTETPKTPPAKIMRSWLCERCGSEFKTDTEYKQHKIDHMQGRVSDKKIDPIVGPVEEIPAEAPEKPVQAPTPDEKAQAAWNKATPVKTELIIAKPKQEPITLHYAYSGTCPTCSTPVETIPLEVELDKTKKVICVAWCPNEKRNIQQRTVAKL